MKFHFTQVHAMSQTDGFQKKTKQDIRLVIFEYPGDTR